MSDRPTPEQVRGYASHGNPPSSQPPTVTLPGSTDNYPAIWLANEEWVRGRIALLDDAIRLAVHELFELRAYLQALDVPSAQTTPGAAP